MSSSSTDHRLRGARDLGQLNTKRAIKDFIGGQDRIDYYRFSLAQRSSLSVGLNYLQQNADIRLLSIDGSVIGSSKQPKRRPELVTASLDTGTYYIAVNGRGSKTRYFMSMIASPIMNAVPIPSSSGSSTPSNTPVSTPSNPIPIPTVPRPSDPDASLDNAFDCGALTVNQVYQNRIGDSDQVDIYKFSLNRISDINASLSDLSLTADINLIVDVNNNGFIEESERLITGYGSAFGGNPVSGTLPPGNYFVEVRTSSAKNSAYSLALAVVGKPNNIVIDPGSLPNSAHNLGVLINNFTAQDLVGELDRTDYYKFTLNQISGFNATLANLSKWVDIELIFDANGNNLFDPGESVASGYGSTSSNQPISKTLPAGNYLVKAEYSSSYGNTTYDLTFSAIAKPNNILVDPGSNLSTAYDLGVLSNQFTAQDLVGELDRTDYYKFTLNQISDFNATLTNLSKWVDIELIFDANGNNLFDPGESIALGSGSTSSNQPISKTLPQGTYFIRTDYSGSYDNTTYDLAFSIVPKPSNLTADPGSSLGTAYDVGTLAGNLVAKDLVGSLDKIDYYKFSLDKSGSFNATLSGLSDGVNIALIADSNGNGLIDGGERLTSGYGSTSSNAPISRTLQAGSYFIEVTPSYSSNNTAYTLTLAG